MQKILGLVAIAALASALPHVALAQNSPQNGSSAPEQVKKSLEQAGFTNVHVMPESFLVRATDAHGNPIMMVINPDSLTAITAVSGAAGNTSQNPEGQTTSKSAKMTDDQRNSGSREQAERTATSDKSTKMSGSGATETVDNEKIPGRPNGMLTEMDDQQALELTAAQRAEIWRTLGSDATERAPTGFRPKVGEAVPNSLQLQSLPRNVSNQVPAVQPYEYAMLHSQLLIVDPATKKIVAIITE